MQVAHRYSSLPLDNADFDAPAQSATHVGEYYVRFMSNDEYNKLIMGLDITNARRHSKECRSSSVGCCFMPLKSIKDDFMWRGYNGTLISIIKCAYEILTGVICEDVAVIFQNVSTHMEDTYGTYADLCSDDWGALRGVEEACATVYNKYTMRPVAVFENFREGKWALFERLRVLRRAQRAKRVS